MGAKVQWYRGAWWVMTHANGTRKRRRFGSTAASKALAQTYARTVQGKLLLGELVLGAQEPSAPEAVPFREFADGWVRREVLLPIERGDDERLAPGTARSYAQHVRLYLKPYFGEKNVREFRVADVRAFCDHCTEKGRPRSRSTLKLILATLRLILADAQERELVEVNAVSAMQSGKRRKRRSAQVSHVAPEKVLSFEELDALLLTARREAERHFPLFVFLADTGARFGEATALRWRDVDLAAGTARIARSFSSGKYLGQTKTGRERTLDLSTRLRAELAAVRPDLFPDDALAFPNEAGGFIDPGNFRSRVWDRVVRKALGAGRTFTPHGLRHTFASLHMARGTNLKWIQAQGGWSSAKLLLDCYGHHMPTESNGLADALSTAPARPLAGQFARGYRAATPKERAPARPSMVAQGGIEPPTRGFSVRCSTI